MHLRRRPEHRAERGTDLVGAFGRRLGQKDGELVPADPEHDRARLPRRGALERRCDRDEEVVTRRVPARVVRILQSVDVGEDHADRRVQTLVAR